MYLEVREGGRIVSKAVRVAFGDATDVQGVEQARHEPREREACEQGRGAGEEQREERGRWGRDMVERRGPARPPHERGERREPEESAQPVRAWLGRRVDVVFVLAPVVAVSATVVFVLARRTGRQDGEPHQEQRRVADHDGTMRTLREVVERVTDGSTGNTGSLSEQEEDDLVTYLMRP